MEGISCAAGYTEWEWAGRPLLRCPVNGGKFVLEGCKGTFPPKTHQDAAMGPPDAIGCYRGEMEEG